MMEHSTSFQSQQQSHSHHHNNHSRRSSSTAPYSIPLKLSVPLSSSPRTSSEQHHNQQQQLSSSVPLLSREFVVRRISEGETGRLKEELKCEACGKGYKHISSLAKHLWEHTPEWNVTKKLLISKHQQVQLLEAASILCSMNEQQAAAAAQSSSSKSTTPVLSPDVKRSSSPEEINRILDSKRKNSISQYPPSTPFQKSQSNSRKSPVHESTSADGGYLDTSTSMGPSSTNTSSTNTAPPDLRGKDGLLNPNSNDDEGEQIIENENTQFVPRGNSANPDEVIEDDDDEDDGVFGQMD